MTGAAARNGFAPAIHRLSLWAAIKKSIGSLTKQPNSTILKIERAILTPSSDGLN
jgi:hypothetical protein